MSAAGESGRRRLTVEEIEQARHTPGRSTLLFITDRCPVGCAHCSVDSRRDSPTITDFELFGEIVEWLCEQPQLEIVGISGGEPFVERRGLTLATRRLVESGKQLVLYTSGVWASSPTTPRWIEQALQRASCVYLSTDAFHAASMADERYVRAAQAIAASGAWIVTQVIGSESMVEHARALLVAAFGEHWDRFAELRLTSPLTHGRGANVFTPTAHQPGQEFGACRMVASPMVRYDGLVTACCNESVIMGLGPKRLRRRAASRAEVGEAVNAFHSDSFLRAIGGVGIGALTGDPRYSDLAERDFKSICTLCWKMLDRLPEEAAPDPIFDAINAVLVPAR